MSTNVLSIASQVSVATAAAQAGVATNTTPFLPTRSATLNVDVDGVTGTPSVTIQTSPDNATWTTQATISAQKSMLVEAITLDKYIRLDVSVAGSAGTVSAWLTP